MELVTKSTTIYKFDDFPNDYKVYKLYKRQGADKFKIGEHSQLLII